MNNSRKTALVTGASRGIGRAVSIELISAGYSVTGISRNINIADHEMVELAQKNGVKYTSMQADIANFDDQQRIRTFLEKEYDYLNVLIHNAGIAPLIRKDVLEMSMESYEEVMSINLTAPVFLTQLLYPLMYKADSGKLIFVSSVSAETASEDRAEYCISKAGLSMFSKIMASRLASSPIRVYEVRPGIIETDMTRPVLDKYKKMIDEGLVPQGRIGTANDIARVIRALVSGDFDYANGLVLEISGGMQIRSL